MLKNFNKNCRNNRYISIFTSISYQQYDTLLPIPPCTHKLKAGTAYWGAMMLDNEHHYRS
jgi:hypothetical protein